MKNKILEIPYRRIVEEVRSKKGLLRPERLSYRTYDIEILTDDDFIFCCNRFRLYCNKRAFYIYGSMHTPDPHIGMQIHQFHGEESHIDYCPFCGAKLKLVEKERKVRTVKKKRVSKTVDTVEYNDASPDIKLNDPGW
jgi:hypothetical protein